MKNLPTLILVFNIIILTGITNKSYASGATYSKTPKAIKIDTTLSRRQLKRLPKNTFEMGMRDAKKYYKPRYRGEIHNPNNPNNWRIDTDPAYKNGYILMAKQKVSLRNTIITYGIIIGIGLPVLYLTTQ